MCMCFKLHIYLLALASHLVVCPALDATEVIAVCSDSTRASIITLRDFSCHWSFDWFSALGAARANQLTGANRRPALSFVCHSFIGRFSCWLPSCPAAVAQFGRSAFLRRWRFRCPTMPSRAVSAGRKVPNMGRDLPTPPCFEIPLASCYAGRASSATSCFPRGGVPPASPVSQTGRTPSRVRMFRRGRFPSVSSPIPASCSERSPTPAPHGRHLRYIGLSSTGRDARFCLPYPSRTGRRFLPRSLSDRAAVHLRVARPLACLVEHRVSHSTEGQRRYTEMPNNRMQLTAPSRLFRVRESSWAR